LLIFFGFTFPSSLLKNCLTGMLYWEANPH
jgi:hypothetical protein